MSAAELDALAAQVAAPPQRPPAPLRFERRPRMKLVTSRGELVFELFSDEAPEHVANLVELARRDHYDGLTFHRVVPDFVVQGGCFRGDGNGGGTWRGREDELPHEISPRKYVRGSLGMPRWDYVNSGGSQFFVAHRATPHLDGRYTIFGELREGFDVLDQLEVGDTIVDVVISE
jgi:peptidyl-prolyl cis-trans isomerase B (cyclophilin B)